MKSLLTFTHIVTIPRIFTLLWDMNFKLKILLAFPLAFLYKKFLMDQF